jgi:hypothetical protein
MSPVRKTSDSYGNTYPIQELETLAAAARKSTRSIHDLRAAVQELLTCHRCELNPATVNLTSGCTQLHITDSQYCAPCWEHLKPQLTEATCHCGNRILDWYTIQPHEDGQVIIKTW